MSHWTLDGCPSEDLVAAFVGGELDPDEHASIEAHLDACKPCRTVVADLVRMFADPNMPTLASDPAVSLEGEPSAHAHVAVGATVGRYVIEDVLGMGGMGVVYLAHDPELDRKVALKVIRRRGGRDAADQSARLLREARAMAKLSHPNVITVHDVGTWHGQVFVAMEFASGGTLKGALKEATRTWAALGRTLLAAGRGLAAAHQAGLVHRDFKPDNVLLGEGNRVFVTDFGLARWGASGAVTHDRTLDPETPSVEADLEALTRTGAFVGTPAYMAPEQFLGSDVGPACDQFAFCVVMWEALFGQRPFEGKTIPSLAHAVCETPTPPIPTSPAVPRRVRLALARGLSKRPADRFASMQALLDAIGPARSTTAPWVLAGLLGAAAVPLGVMALQRPTPPPHPSEAACANLQGLQAWNETSAAAITTAFERTDARTAAGVAREVRTRLDAYAQQWADRERALCEASTQGSVDPDRAALRHQCLDRARTVLTGVVEGFTHADAQVVRRANQAVASLPNLATCSDDAQLMAEKPPAPPEAIAARVQAVRDALTAADAEHSIGRYAEGLALVDAQVDEAKALGFRPLLGEVAYARGRLLGNLGRHADAEAAHGEAELHAMASRYPTLLARTLILRIYAMALQRQDWSAIAPILARAEATLDSTNLPAEIRGTLYTNASIAAFYGGDSERAAAMAERALTLTDREVDPLRWAAAAQAQVLAERTLGESEGAEPRLQEIVEIYRQELGALHPDLAEAYRDLANVYRAQERFDDARQAANRALQLIETIFGPDHFEYGGTLSTLSGIEGAAGNYAEALALAERSAAVLGAAGMSTQIPRAQQTEWLIALERPDEAEPILEALIAQEIEQRGEGPNVAWMLFIRCAVQAARHDVDATRTACDAAIEASGASPRDVLMIEMQLDRATYLAKAGAPDEARDALQALEAEVTALDPSPTRDRFFTTLAELRTRRPL